MIKRCHGLAVLVLACVGGALALPASPAHAADADVSCELKFKLAGWSAIYEHAEGSGVVMCKNGQHAKVKISLVGGGITAGKFRVDDGKGDITHVRSIDDVFGDYAEADVQAGVIKSGTAQVLTKGTTSLALTGTGEGVDLGVSLGKFTITRR